MLRFHKIENFLISQVSKDGEFHVYLCTFVYNFAINLAFVTSELAIVS